MPLSDLSRAAWLPGDPSDGHRATAACAKGLGFGPQVCSPQVQMTSSNDAQAVSRLKHTAQAVASKASWRLTTKLFVRRNGKFVYED
jgi:hypothetical protein